MTLSAIETETPVRVLLVEDSEDDMILILRELARSGIKADARRVETEEALVSELASASWDIVISDFNLPRLTGLRALERVRSAHPGLPFILVSGSVGERLAVEAMQAGAQDYIMKDNMVRLASAVRRELQKARERLLTEAVLQEKDKQLVTAQRMEAVGRLAGGIAHDLNNMIAACTLYAEMALEPDQGIEQVRDSVREIIKAQERSTRLIAQLLAFSRRQYVDPRVMSLNHLVSDLHKMFSQILGEDVELELALAQDLPSICADPTQMDQVLMNLVVNARDAMPKGGKLRIETRGERSATGGAGELVRLTVTDTGMGIDEKILSKIFEPFFTTKEVGKGTGLGLSTVFGIVRQAGGEVRVRSRVGEGTSFDVLLPAVRDALSTGAGIAAPAEVPVSARRRPSAAILLVEDDASIRAALTKGMTKLGYRVHAAADGEEGLRLFDAHRDEIELLVSDVVMPKLSGPDLMRRLQAQKPALKVLFLSGYGNDVLESHGIGPKDIHLLPKPFSTRKFVEAVEAVLGVGPAI